MMNMTTDDKERDMKSPVKTHNPLDKKTIPQGVTKNDMVALPLAESQPVALDVYPY